MAITWLVGKSNNVDLVWSAYTNEIITSPSIVRNIDLFDDKKYKYIYNKKDIGFFKEYKGKLSRELIIKGVPKFDELIMSSHDYIIYVDTLNQTELFNYYCKISNVKFSSNEIEIIKKLKSLEDLATTITLKNLDIELEYWNIFYINEKDNWYKLQKENKLVYTGIFNNNQIIPVMIYLINSKAKQREILLFLHAKIKQGHQIWEFNKLWESCVKCL